MTLNHRLFHSRIPIIGVSVALAVAASLACSGRAVAAPPTEDAPPSLTLTYSASELTNDGVARALYRRIAVAAMAVCPDYDSRDLGAFEATQACRRQAIAQALAQIDNDRLASVAQAIERR
jgi:UrcA family protein